MDHDEVSDGAGSIMHIIGCEVSLAHYPIKLLRAILVCKMGHLLDLCIIFLPAIKKQRENHPEALIVPTGTILPRPQRSARQAPPSLYLPSPAPARSPPRRGARPHRRRDKTERRRGPDSPPTRGVRSRIPAPGTDDPRAPFGPEQSADSGAVPTSGGSSPPRGGTRLPPVKARGSRNARSREPPPNPYQTSPGCRSFPASVRRQFPRECGRGIVGDTGSPGLRRLRSCNGV
mmetsp:Transcript_3324/g.8595  ORF Transcript_3324/g.8595 Transcript_3324/m.8595 type:complete len:232 (+) Transcript_3324:72-767(+)